MQNTPAANLFEIDAEIASIHARRTPLILAMQKLDAERTTLNGRVKSSNGHRTRLSPEEYRQICNRQSVISRKKTEILNELAPLKTKLRDLESLSTQFRAQMGILSPREQSIERVDILRPSVVAIRDKWLGFAEDQTRVSSMRLMASQIARELTDLLALSDARD
jgi:predicted  nucleic acid-binding Zn-ribbon protein